MPIKSCKYVPCQLRRYLDLMRSDLRARLSKPRVRVTSSRGRDNPVRATGRPVLPIIHQWPRGGMLPLAFRLITRGFRFQSCWSLRLPLAFMLGQNGG